MLHLKLGRCRKCPYTVKRPFFKKNMTLELNSNCFDLKTQCFLISLCLKLLKFWSLIFQWLSSAFIIVNPDLESALLGHSNTLKTWIVTHSSDPWYDDG